MQMYNQQGITDNYPQYTTNFWGDAGNNYGFGSSNISQNIQNVTNRFNNSGFNGGMNDYERGINKFEQASAAGSFMSGMNSGFGGNGYSGSNNFTDSYGSGNGNNTTDNNRYSWSSGYSNTPNNQQNYATTNYVGNTYATFSPQTGIWAQQRRRAVENDMLMNGMDTLYGMNRTLNGMTFGGLDWLGNKLGFDSQMNDYLQLKDAQSRNLAQTAGQIAGYGGNALTGSAVAQAVYPPANMAYNGYKIGKAYDRLSQNPYQGNGSDVIARMRNHNGEPVILQRGEVIQGENGQPVVYGKNLRRATGTLRNYGLDKIIHKHNMPRDEVVRIPRYLKQNQPLEVSPRGQNVYAIQQPNGEIRLITTPKNGENIVSSMYYLNR